MTQRSPWIQSHEKAPESLTSPEPLASRMYATHGTTVNLSMIGFRLA